MKNAVYTFIAAVVILIIMFGFFTFVAILIKIVQAYGFLGVLFCIALIILIGCGLYKLKSN